MPLAETFQEIVDSLPVGLDRPRVRPAAGGREPLRRRGDPARDLQRAAVLAGTTGTGGCSSPTASATRRPRRRPHGTLKLLDDAGIARRARAARDARGPRRDDPGLGPPGVVPARVPAPARAVVARVVAVFDDLLLGSNVLGMLRAAGHDATLTGGADVQPDGADVLVVDLAAGDVRRGRRRRIADVGRSARPEPALWASTVTSTSDTRNRAEAAGFDLVVPRSRMAREGAQLVERLARETTSFRRVRLRIRDDRHQKSRQGATTGDRPLCGRLRVTGCSWPAVASPRRPPSTGTTSRRCRASRPRSAPPPARSPASRRSRSTSPSQDILTPGDEPDVLVAMNPAALRSELPGARPQRHGDRQRGRVQQAQPAEGGLRVQPARGRLARRLPPDPDPDDVADRERGRGDGGRLDA